MEPRSKPWFTSKLNLQGFLSIVAGIALYLTNDEFVKNNLMAVIPALVAINGVIQVILRTFFTVKPITPTLSGKLPY